MTEPFPWGDYLAVGLGQLNIPPSEFWRMTLREFWAIHKGKTAQTARAKPMQPERLQELMKRFPDVNQT